VSACNDAAAINGHGAVDAQGALIMKTVCMDMNVPGWLPPRPWGKSLPSLKLDGLITHRFPLSEWREAVTVSVGKRKHRSIKVALSS
jgi:hypothetical protein